MKILQTPTFSRQVKKLHINQKKELDLAIMEVFANPLAGDMKKGDLHGVQVFKFSMVKQLTLIAYEYDEIENELTLLSLGSHENFYRDLKR